MNCNFIKNDDGSIKYCRILLPIISTVLLVVMVTIMMMNSYLKSIKKDISDLRGAVVPLIEKVNEERRIQEEQFRKYMQEKQLRKQLENEKKQQPKP